MIHGCAKAFCSGDFVMTLAWQNREQNKNSQILKSVKKSEDFSHQEERKTTKKEDILIVCLDFL